MGRSAIPRVVWLRKNGITEGSLRDLRDNGLHPRWTMVKLQTCSRSSLARFIKARKHIRAHVAHLRAVARAVADRDLADREAANREAPRKEPTQKQTEHAAALARVKWLEGQVEQLRLEIVRRDELRRSRNELDTIIHIATTARLPPLNLAQTRTVMTQTRTAEASVGWPQPLAWKPRGYIEPSLAFDARAGRYFAE